MNTPTASPHAAPARVFCADDNPQVTEALRLQIERSPDFRWMGCAENADDLLDAVASGDCPEIVLMDIDMPGKDPFAAIVELLSRCHNVRVLMFTGMVHRDLIDRAVEAGAWGYVAKGDGEHALLAMRKVLEGEVYLSPEAQAIYRG